MDDVVVDTPHGADFEPTRDDDVDEGQSGVVSDEIYDDACLASSDLRELGLLSTSPWAGYRVYQAAEQLFRDYRAARAAADLGRSNSAALLQEAGSRLYEEAVRVLVDFPGWTSGDFKRL